MRRRIDFDALFLALNDLPGFEEWVFHPGMLFDTRGKWWTDRGSRGSAHEGVDFCLYAGADTAVHALEPGSLVPAMDDGTVTAVREDLLGRTVFVRHDAAGDKPLFSIYAHVEPCAAIAPGARVAAGHPLAAVAALRRRVPGMLPHLHLSFALIRPECGPHGPDWTMINERKGLELLDPLRLLRCRHRVEAAVPRRQA
jgi:murein DD-endopeptidase MepM/ murein hydrolase activator NlpD